MTISLTTRIKVAILFLGLLLSILTVAIISDAWGIRSYSPAPPAKNNNGTGIVVPPSSPGPKPKFVKPKLPLKPVNNVSIDDGDTDSENSNDSGNSSDGEPPSPGGGGGGGGGGPAPLPELKEVKPLFKVDTPAKIKLDDPAIFDTDFVHLLPDMPMRSSGFVGIVNKGNSCYADATLQMLYRIPFIRKVIGNFDVYYERAKIVVKEKSDNIKSLADKSDPDSIKKMSRLNTELSEIIEAVSVLEGLNHMFYQLHTSNTPAKFGFKRSMQCMPGKFAKYEQEDADEYFTKITGCIKDILPASQHHHFMLNLVYGGTEFCPNDPLYTFDRSEIITPQAKLSLNLKETRPPVYKNGVRVVEPDETLNDLFDKYFAEEIIDGFSLEIGGKGQLVKYTKLVNPPEILTLQLNRVVDFKRNIKKTDNVLMPHDLDIGKLIGDGKSSIKYRLKMIVEHQGSSGSSGHYVAHHRESNGKWVTYDDSVTYSCSNIDDVMKIGYIYFYERVV